MEERGFENKKVCCVEQCLADLLDFFGNEERHAWVLSVVEKIYPYADDKSIKSFVLSEIDKDGLPPDRPFSCFFHGYFARRAERDVRVGDVLCLIRPIVFVWKVSVMMPDLQDYRLVLEPGGESRVLRFRLTGGGGCSACRATLPDSSTPEFVATLHRSDDGERSTAAPSGSPPATAVDTTSPDIPLLPLPSRPSARRPLSPAPAAAASPKRQRRSPGSTTRPSPDRDPPAPPASEPPVGPSPADSPESSAAAAPRSAPADARRDDARAMVAPAADGQVMDASQDSSVSDAATFMQRVPASEPSNPYTLLADIGLNDADLRQRPNLMGVIVSEPKPPGPTSRSFMAMVIIKDPSCCAEDAPRCDFLLFAFVSSPADLPAVEPNHGFQVGNIIRARHVKIESHSGRLDGRVFRGSALTVFSGGVDGPLTPLGTDPPPQVSDAERARLRWLREWWAHERRHQERLAASVDAKLCDVARPGLYNLKCRLQTLEEVGGELFARVQDGTRCPVPCAEPRPGETNDVDTPDVPETQVFREQTDCVSVRVADRRCAEALRTHRSSGVRFLRLMRVRVTDELCEEETCSSGLAFALRREDEPLALPLDVSSDEVLAIREQMEATAAPPAQAPPQPPPGAVPPQPVSAGGQPPTAADPDRQVSLPEQPAAQHGEKAPTDRLTDDEPASRAETDAGTDRAATATAVSTATTTATATVPAASTVAASCRAPAAAVASIFTDVELGRATSGVESGGRQSRQPDDPGTTASGVKSGGRQTRQPDDPGTAASGVKSGGRQTRQSAEPGTAASAVKSGGRQMRQPDDPGTTASGVESGGRQMRQADDPGTAASGVESGGRQPDDPGTAASGVKSGGRQPDDPGTAASGGSREGQAAGIQERTEKQQPSQSSSQGSSWYPAQREVVELSSQSSSERHPTSQGSSQSSHENSQNSSQPPLRRSQRLAQPSHGASQSSSQPSPRRSPRVSQPPVCSQTSCYPAQQEILELSESPAELHLTSQTSAQRSPGHSETQGFVTAPQSPAPAVVSSAATQSSPAAAVLSVERFASPWPHEPSAVVMDTSLRLVPFEEVASQPAVRPFRTRCVLRGGATLPASGDPKPLLMTTCLQPDCRAQYRGAAVPGMSFNDDLEPAFLCPRCRAEMQMSIVLPLEVQDSSGAGRTLHALAASESAELLLGTAVHLQSLAGVRRRLAAVAAALRTGIRGEVGLLPLPEEQERRYMVVSTELRGVLELH